MYRGEGIRSRPFHDVSTFHLISYGARNESVQTEPGVRDGVTDMYFDLTNVGVSDSWGWIVGWGRPSATFLIQGISLIVSLSVIHLLDRNCVAQPITYLKIAESSLTVLHEYDFACTLLLALVELGVLRKCNLFVLSFH